MKILLLHPDDSPLSGPWAKEKWDLIVDIGFAGASVYSEWTAQTGAPVTSLRSFTHDSYRWIGKTLQAGRNRLLDRNGLDWWELSAVLAYQDLEALFLVRRLLDQLPVAPLEFFASKLHRSAALLSQLSRTPVCYLGRESLSGRYTGKFRRLHRFPIKKILEIATDKFDPSCRLRRAFYKPARCHDPLVVLPSAYSNVTRTVLAYAEALPQRNFLLVATRPSALPRRVPENVRTVSLAAYAVPTKHTQSEIADLTRDWLDFVDSVLRSDEHLSIALDAGMFDFFPRHLRSALLIRDAWTNLLRREPAVGVLCADDLNHYTRLPLAIAGQMRLNTACCSHGALDGGLLFKQSYAGVHLVKGEMEKDYAARSGTVDASRIVISAPPLPPSRQLSEKPNLVFFSQPYELDGGRTGEIYREIIPRLCNVARSRGLQLLIKLHPFEQIASRRALLNSVLSREDAAHLRVVSNLPPGSVIDQAWCGVGLDSSVAVECALKGIPFFLCQWLDFGGAGYMQQFAHFGAGQLLSSPDDLLRIPELVSLYSSRPRPTGQLWQVGDCDQLDHLLFGMRPAVEQRISVSAAD